MIKIENTKVFGLEMAVLGSRNPMNSRSKSDSFIGKPDEFGNNVTLGKNDLALLSKLSAAGNDHGKFMRMIHVQCDVTAPLYWLKEADTYKVGTVCNSSSTMHKIHAKKFTLDDFSYEHLDAEGLDWLEYTIKYLNANRDFFNNGTYDEGPGNKEYWYHMIQALPSSYNQLRTYDLNYAVLKNIYHARKNHKLDCWHTFCAWIETLPYAKELIIGEKADV